MISLPQLPGSNELTGSRISTYQTCPREEFYAYQLGIRREQTAHYFRMGSCFHLGLDLRAQGKSQDEAIAGAVATYDQFPHWATSEEAKHEWLIEREIVARLLSGYFWYWEREDIRPDIRPVKIIETEGSFNVPIKNPETGRATTSFSFSGKRDKIVELGDSRIAVMEHKTTSDDISPTSDYWLRLRIDSQISGYMLAAREQGYKVETVLYDVCKKPTISPKQIPVLDDDGFKVVVDTATGERVFNKKKEGTDGDPRQSADKEKGWVLQARVEMPEEFGDRLTDDIAARPEHYYQRQEIPRLDADLEEFATQLWQIQQQIKESQAKGRAFRNTSACLKQRRCPYLDICHQGINMANGIPAGFRQVTTLHEELE